MKYIITICAALWCLLLCACGGQHKNEPREPAAGSFITETGVRFDLREDSTTLITFSDSLTYEGTWAINRSHDNIQFINIEFGGWPRYFYLKDHSLYHSDREMRHDIFGMDVRFIE